VIRWFPFLSSLNRRDDGLSNRFAPALPAVWVMLILATLAYAARGQNRPPRFDRVQFAIRSGQSELARGAAATAIVKSIDGKILKQVQLKTPEQAPWKPGTTHYGIFGLREPLEYCYVGSVEVSFQPPAIPSLGGTSWTIQTVSFALSIENVNQTSLVNAGDASTPSSPPAIELNAGQPTFSFKVPCTRQTTLYERLGSQQTLDKVVEDFTRRLSKDKRLGSNFRPIARDHDRLRDFKKRFARKMCQLSGGPCVLSAKEKAPPLTDIVKSLADFRAIIDNLVSAMDKFPASVSIRDKNELLGMHALAPATLPVVLPTGHPPTVPLSARITAQNSSPIGSPIFVNLYWDSMWDTDNASAGLAQQSVDGVVQAVTGSSYFPGLQEYKVNSASFFASFLPHPKCVQKPDSTVPFYDPVNTSIMGFLNCQLQHNDGIPQGDNVVYNIIMPAGTTESDSLVLSGFIQVQQCSGPNSATGWHFHGSPYDIATDISDILGGALGGLVGFIVGIFTGNPGGGTVNGAELGAIIGFFLAMSNEGSPFWTITSTSPSCQNFTDNLVHEMVETAVDSKPPLSVVTGGGGGELVDFCPDNQATPSPSWVPTRSLPSGITLNPGTFASMQVPQYWSNVNQQCGTGFTDTTTPSTPSVNMTGMFPVATFTLTGSGFGATPGAFSIPTSTSMPYLGIQDTTQAWQAGNSLNANPLPFTVTSWSDSAITISGFSPPSGSNLAMQNGDKLVVWICNPASGFCSSTSVSATISGSGQNPNDIVSIGVTITTGNDNARADTELWLTIEDQPPQCLKPSNNADSDSVCTNGGSARDQNGRQEWKNGTTDPKPQVFAVAVPSQVLSSLSITLNDHHTLFETGDNWDIQAITITGTTRGGVTSTLFTQTNPMPPNDNNCIARLKTPQNSTTARFPLNGVGVPTYVGGKPSENGAATACKNNGDQ
jgi:hemoglobin